MAKTTGSEHEAAPLSARGLSRRHVVRAAAGALVAGTGRFSFPNNALAQHSGR